MAANKTEPTGKSVKAYVKNISDEQRRRDCNELIALMTRLTGKNPCMWGDSIVGFGTYHYKYASGREGDWFLIGFSSRKKDLTVYIIYGLDSFESLLQDLGKHRRGKSCLYLKDLQNIDMKILEKIIKKSLTQAKKYSP